MDTLGALLQHPNVYKIQHRILLLVPLFCTFQIIERKTKRLENTRASLPPSNPDLLFSQLSWLNGLDSAVVKRLRNYAKIQQYNAGDFLTKAEECSTGLFIVISGLVKVKALVLSL